MSITRLQQARQMYALGQRVRFQGGGRDASQDDFGSPSGGGNKGGGNGGDRPNPHTASGTSKTSTRGPKSYDGPGNIHSDDPKAPPAYEIIGGTKYDVTPDTKKERELARMKQTILDAPLPNITKKGTEYYDPNTGTVLGFAPTNQKSFGLLDIALMAATGGLFGTKVATGLRAYNTAKNIAQFAQNIGLTDKNVVGAFTDSLTSNLSDKFSGFGKGTKSKTKSSIDTDLSKIGNGDGGLDTLANTDALNQEYLLLLNKFNTGTFTDADKVRFTFLQKILGK